MAVVGTAYADPTTISTRFGPIKNNADNLLEYRGKTLKPEVFVPSAAYVVRTFKLSGSDVILVNQAAGNTCPGQYTYVTVDATSVKVSPTFGTCNGDIVEPVQIDESIAFSMKKLGGKGTSRYIYERGIIFEDGKPVKGE